MPITRRDRTGGAPRFVRALTAVIALYALVLQILLGGIAALPVAGNVLCAEIADGVETTSGDAASAAERPAPGAHHADCCTGAPHAPATALPPLASAAVAWPERAAVPAGWSALRRPTARPPPFTLAHARAPPSA